MALQNRREYLTTTPIPKLILSLSVPTIISMMVTAIYNTADTFFVARVSSDSAINTAATASVGLVFTIMALIQATGFFWWTWIWQLLIKNAWSRQPQRSK